MGISGAELARRAGIANHWMNDLMHQVVPQSQWPGRGKRWDLNEAEAEEMLSKISPLIQDKMRVKPERTETMPLITTAMVLDKLFHHLGDEQWDLGELLADAAYGADILNEETKALVKMLFQSIDAEEGDLYFDQIVEGIRHVGTEYAVAVANDMRDAEPIVD
jgi:hypothetical protein